MKGIQKIDHFDFQKVISNRYIGHLGTLPKLGHVRKTPLGPKLPTFLDSSYQNESIKGILAISEIQNFGTQNGTQIIKGLRLSLKTYIQKILRQVFLSLRLNIKDSLKKLRIV